MKTCRKPLYVVKQEGLPKECFIKEYKLFVTGQIFRSEEFEKDLTKFNQPLELNAQFNALLEEPKTRSEK